MAMSRTDEIRELRNGGMPEREAIIASMRRSRAHQGDVAVEVPPPVPAPLESQPTPFPTPWSKEDMWEAENRMRDPNYPRMPRTIPGGTIPGGGASLPGYGQLGPPLELIGGQAAPRPQPIISPDPYYDWPGPARPAPGWRGMLDFIRQLAQRQMKKRKLE